MSRTAGLIAMLLVAQAASAEWSGNVGWQSHYVFRGVPQHESSAQGGLDFESGGFYAGTWAADVGAGAEVDAYAGYGWTVNDFSFGIGATGYFYTDDFDDTYQEINLNFGTGGFSLDVAIGEYENFSGPTQDYTFISGTYEHDSGVYGVIGSFGDDFDGEYYELGYGFEVNGVEFSVAWIHSVEDLIGDGDNNNLVFGIGKGFDLNSN